MTTDEPENLGPPDDINAGAEPEKPGVFVGERPPARVERLELRRPQFWSRGMRIAVMGVLFAAFWFWQDIQAILSAPQTSWEDLGSILFPPAALLLWLAWRRWDTPRQARAIEFGAEGVELPRSPDSRRSVFLPYRDLHGVLAMARGNTRAVLIDTGEITLGYDDSDFSEANYFHPTSALAEELARRVSALPERDQVLERMAQRSRVSQVATRRPAPVTRGLLLLLAGYFGVELLTGALEGPLGLIRLGANAPALIEAGQYWRLISGNFLHGGWAHMILNGVALYFLGVAVEKLLGSWRFILIYLISAIAGSIASWLFGPGAMSVGSSTAIFGLFGAFLALHLRYWSQLPPPFRQSKRWWVIIILINGSLPLLVPIIDSAAHIGGMLAGLALAGVMVARAPTLQPGRRPARWVELATGLVSALSVAGLLFAGFYAFQARSADEDTVLASMLDEALESGAAPETINEISWMLATSDKAARSQLIQARDALRGVVSEEEGRVEIRDTLATVEYRIAGMSSGENRARALSRAVNIQVGVVADALSSPRLGFETMVFTSQLARFLDFQLSVEGSVPGVKPGGAPPELKIHPSGAIDIITAEELSAPRLIYAPVKSKERLLGLARVCLPESGEARSVEDFEGVEALKAAHKSGDIRARAAWIGEIAGCPEENITATFWPMSADIRGLP